MNPLLIFQEHLEKNADGKMEWRPGTPPHIRAAGRGYKKWLGENPGKEPTVEQLKQQQ